MAKENREGQHRFDPDFSVVDETEDFIVVDKPAPLQVHPSVPGNPPTLLDGLRELLAYEIANGARLSIINQLDRETSGLVLVAKNRATARGFHHAMERRRTRKTYFAIVHGWPREARFTVDAPLRRKGEFTESAIWVKRAVHPGGSPAITEFEVSSSVELETPVGTRFSFLRVRPHSGRTHQIRVHLAHAGHPILGDKIYGGDESAYLEFIESGWSRDLEGRLYWPRHALHCEGLEITVDGRLWRWNVGPPAEFSAFFGNL